MLKREHIKWAIEAISARNPRVGHTLDEMLAAGSIDALPERDPEASPREFVFLFNHDPVHVPVFRYFHEGITPVEERLLVKYGELVRRQEYLTGAQPYNFRQAAEEIRAAGLRFLVEYEIDLALDNLDRNGEARDREAARRLEAILEPDSALQLPRDRNDPRVLFCGKADQDTPALFLNLPFCLESLLQAADLNLEFFGIRFILDCLARGLAKSLFCCVVNQKITGLVQLVMKSDLSGRDLEIKYIATARGKPVRADLPILRPPRGCGTVLAAGAWMLWQGRLKGRGELVLDSELGSLGFYESMGFRKKRAYGYSLKTPQGRLLRNILAMTENSPQVEKGVLDAVKELIRGQVNLLRKAPGRTQAQKRREIAAGFIRDCLQIRRHGELGRTALGLLAKHRAEIPEADRLMDLAISSGLIHVPEKLKKDWSPVLAVFDGRYARHLEGVFHLESSKRAQAMESILRDQAVKDRWSALVPRPAALEELAYVHTARYIDQIASTAGRPLMSLDLDTQTSERTFEVARLAVGGVFRLLDEIQAGASSRGFALVRPPGHHAGPDKAMGYCIFNNAALGARYLQEKHGLERIMIVDLDAHHGNGTQAAFYDTDRVLYFSLHQYPFYPGTGGLGESGTGRGKGFTVNVPLPAGETDATFADIISYLVRALARQFGPKMILVSCGFDLYQHDPSSRMKATPEGYGVLTRLLMEIAGEVCQGRLAFIMEGGYSLTGIRECGRMVMRELCGLKTFDQDRLERMKKLNGRKIPELKKVLEVQRAYWTIQ